MPKTPPLDVTGRARPRGAGRAGQRPLGRYSSNLRGLHSGAHTGPKFSAHFHIAEAKYPKAAECLKKDRDELLTFYDFPAQHWTHLRTTNPIESMFATVRLRTDKTKGCGSRTATLTTVFQLAESAQKRWRRLNGHQLIGDVIAGIGFKDGEKVAA